MKRYMNKEIEMIPRVWTFKTAKEAFEARTEFMKIHCIRRCFDCKYSAENNGVPCDLNWLYEEVEK